MDVPLDDLIKSRRRGGGRGGRRGGGGGASGAYSGHDDRTSGGAFRRARNTQRNNPYKSNRNSGNSDGIWEHDRFDDEEEGEEEEYDTPVTTRGSFTGSLETGTKLQISNLADSVNDTDIKDLFEPFGEIKRSSVNFDKSGRSLGTATVVFARKASAQEAIKKYNNVPLDNQPMKISLVNATGAVGRTGGRGMRSDDGGLRSFNRALRDVSDITVRVGGGRGARRTTTQGGRRVVVRRTTGGGGGGGRGGRGGRGRGRGGRSGGRQLYVRY